MLGWRSLGRQFEYLWAAYAVSSFGTCFAFGAFPLIAIVVLHASPAEVSALAAVGMAVGAAVAVPLGPWMEFRARRPVMMAMDLSRFAAMGSIPLAYAFGVLSFGQLLGVSVVSGAADITFKAASGACLKSVVGPGDLLTANARMESTTWSSTVLGPPLGGAAIGLLGPVTTVLADAASYLLSALGIRAIGGQEPRPERPSRPDAGRTRAGDLLDGWRYILRHPTLRRQFWNNVFFSGLIMATEPLLAVLMLGRLHFRPWQYGLAFAVPCLGGLIGSRLSRRAVDRFGRRRVMLVGGTVRACWPVWLVFMGPGIAGLLLVMAAEMGLILCIGLSNPVFATYRLEQSPPDRVARVLSAWSVSTKASIAALTALGGLLATFTGPRAAIGIAGALLLGTPLLLPWRGGAGLGQAGPGTSPAVEALAAPGGRDGGGPAEVRPQAGRGAEPGPRRDVVNEQVRGLEQVLGPAGGAGRPAQRRTR
jgi:predicted MFS family arabinose efflux permease